MRMLQRLADIIEEEACHHLLFEPVSRRTTTGLETERNSISRRIANNELHSIFSSGSS